MNILILHFIFLDIVMNMQYFHLLKAKSAYIYELKSSLS